MNLSKVFTIVLIMMVFSVMLCGGCTVHFKASELEVDTETQGRNDTFELEKIDLLS